MSQNPDLFHGESIAISNHRNSPFTRDLLRRRSANQSDGDFGVAIEENPVAVNPVALFEIDRYLTSCGTHSLENVVRSFPDWISKNEDSRLVSVEHSSDSTRHVNITCLVKGRKLIFTATIVELRRLADGGKAIMKSCTSASEA